MAFITLSPQLKDNSFTAVENKFITKYMPVLDAVAVKVYLYGLYLCSDAAAFTVSDLARSLKFYRDAFDMNEVRRIEAKDGSFIIVYLEDGNSSHQLELTWLRDRKEPYNLGDNEFHLAFKVDDYEAAHARHEKMGCICYENPEMGIYFCEDPDGYWLEVIPEKR